MKPSKNSKRYPTIAEDTGRETCEMQKPKSDREIKASQTCVVCETRFAYNSDYLRHMRIHTGEKPYTCIACTRRFSRQSNLNVHMLTHNRSNFHMCSACDSKFRHVSSWKRHMRIHTTMKTYTCEQCSRLFHSKYKLTCHLMMHKGMRKSGKWTSGLKVGDRAGTENSRLQDGSGENVTEMDLGDFWRLLVRRGVRRSPGVDAPTKLEKSNRKRKRDKSKQGMLIHCEKSSSADQIASEIPAQDPASALPIEVSCTKNLSLNRTNSEQMETPSTHPQRSVFPGDSEIWTHQNPKHRNVEQTGDEAVSSIGNSSLKQRLVLPEVTETEIPTNVDALSLHPSGKEACKREGSRALLFCHDCKKYFVRKNDLVRHQWTHSGEKPFMCEQCSRTFARQSNLKVHMLTHNPEKRFSCGLCELQFVHSNSFQRHLRIHRGEKRYMCERCSQQFYTHDKLKCHACYL